MPELFTRFSDAVSISQARRAAGFVPFAFALAGAAAVLARLLSLGALAVGLAAGIAFQLAYPGDFGYALGSGGPAEATWFAFAGGAAALAAGIVLPRRWTSSTGWARSRAGTAALAVLPVALHGFTHWDERPVSGKELTPGLVAALRGDVPKKAVVFSDDATSYEIAAFAPVYVADAPPGHVADTKANRPYAAPRRRARLLPDRRPGDPAPLRGDLARRRPAAVEAEARPSSRLRGRALRPLPSPRVKVLLVTLYFPPAGGGGVQRTLKTATHLPALGIETHVLAPDDPKWVHRDDELQPPTQAWIHRARYVGPRGRRPADELHGTTGLARAGVQARLFGRRLLVPDENVPWNLTAIPAAVRIVRQEGIDVVLTTSPPSSVHFVGAAVKRATGVPWVADLRDSLLAHPHRRAEKRLVRIKELGEARVATLVARYADAIVAAADAIADEARGLEPHGSVVTIANGSDFDDFAGIEHHQSPRFRITHAGSFFGRRDPRPFLTALAESGLDVVARFAGDFRPADREWAESLGLGDRLELIPYVPRRRSLELQRDSEALLLLIPEAGGRGRACSPGRSSSTSPPRGRSSPSSRPTEPPPR